MKIDHLNYCRQFQKQATEFLRHPALSQLDRAQLSHAVDLCRASQKFILPDGGRFLDDSDLRALEGNTRLRLPYPFVALEYIAPRELAEDLPPLGQLFAGAAAGPGLGTSARRRIIFAREGEDGIVISFCVCRDSDGVWAVGETLVVPCTDYLFREQGKVFIKVRDESEPGRIEDWEIVSHDTNRHCDSVSTVLAFVNVLMCSNIRIERSEPQRVSGRKIKAALPFDTYHLLMVDVDRAAKSSSGDGAVPVGHRSLREHARRGHIVRPEGRRPYWRNATIVNFGRGGGKVKKDYRLRNTRRVHLPMPGPIVNQNSVTP